MTVTAFSMNQSLSGISVQFDQPVLPVTSVLSVDLDGHVCSAVMSYSPIRHPKLFISKSSVPPPHDAPLVCNLPMKSF